VVVTGGVGAGFGKALSLAAVCVHRNIKPRSDVVYITSKTGVSMDREHVKGAADKAKGAIKDAAGKVTGDKELQAEGKFDKAKGSAHTAAGDVKDALRDASKDD
jgi:uncharacterized protein YjbJ (UPF0337 family)